MRRVSKSEDKGLMLRNLRLEDEEGHFRVYMDGYLHSFNGVLALYLINEVMIIWLRVLLVVYI